MLAAQSLPSSVSCAVRCPAKLISCRDQPKPFPWAWKLWHGAVPENGGRSCDGSQRRTIVTGAARTAAAAKAAAGAVNSVAVAVPPYVTNVVVAATLYAALCLFLMLFFGNSPRVRNFIKGYWMFVPLSIMYAVLLVESWTPDTLRLMLPGSWQAGFSGFKPQFVPQIQHIMQLFQSSLTAASYYVHVVAINLFLARTIFLEGLKRRVFSAPSLVLAFLCGPLGYIAYQLTIFVISATERLVGKSMRYRDKPIVLKTGQGTITILPAVE